VPEDEEKERYLSVADDEETWTRVLKDSTHILDEEKIEYLAIGSIATNSMGYDEECSDIDLLVAPADAEKAVKALELNGYDTDVSDPAWLFKAVKDRVLVDLIFRVGDMNEITADAEMFRRGRDKDVGGQTIRVVAPEDFLVMQAISNKQDAPEYWYKGLKAAASDNLDWDYVLARGGISPPRVLSLLIYAVSEGVKIPRRILEELFASVQSS
jgi:predicted nucleotidyltransferase